MGCLREGKAMIKGNIHVFKSMCECFAEDLYSIGQRALGDYFYILNRDKFSGISYPIRSNADYERIIGSVMNSREGAESNDIKESEDDKDLKNIFIKEVTKRYNNTIDSLYEFDVHEPMTFVEIWILARGLAEIYELVSKKADAGKIDLLTLKVFADSNEMQIAIRSKYFELMGYWTAATEKRKKNPGADAMKQRGESNAKAIKEIMKTFQIKDTSIFRKDKKLRENFFSMAKEMTDCSSEDRILKIARSLRGKALP